jgi:hypothetical protein
MNEPGGPLIGGLYSTIADELGTFGVVKVLAVDERAVHVRLYGNRYPARPTTIDPASLSLGRLTRLPDGRWGPPDGPMGIGHLPISHHQFAAWTPELIGVAPVTNDELDGYREWQAANGGVWG